MAHGLEEWLALAWTQCAGTRQPVSFSKIYGIYETAVDPNERGFALGSNGLPTDFPDIDVPLVVQAKFEDEALARNDRGEFGAMLFMDQMKGEDDDPLLMGGLNTQAGYLYFPSPSYSEGASRNRIVINASPYNKLIRMMRMVVREMNSPGGGLRNANGAKVMTQACYQSGRNDTLIIYTRDRHTADRALATVGMWIAEGLFSTRDFGALLPKTVKRVYTGVGYACEPPQKQLLRSYSQTLSYGKFLSQIIYIACAIALTAGIKSVKQFSFLATYVLQLAGVQAPDEPYEFGVISPSLADCLPWDDSSPWSDERQAQIKKTKLYKIVTERTEIAFSYFG